MPDFGIVFSGLLCHAQINANTRAAVIIRDNKHAARIWVKAGDVLDPAPTFHEAPSVGQWRLFTIPNNARIQLNGLQQGPVVAPPTNDVANVTELLAPGFTMADEIKATQEHPWVRGYVVYSGGKTFTTSSYHKWQANFDGGPYYCRSREALLTTTSVDPTVEIVDVPNHRRMTVANNATIAFTHLDTGDSFDHILYKNMSKQPVGVKAIGINSTECQPQTGILPFTPESKIIDDHFNVFSVSVECMSTQWP